MHQSQNWTNELLAWKKRAWVSPRIWCFIWKILHNEVPTRELLQRRYHSGSTWWMSRVFPNYRRNDIPPLIPMHSHYPLPGCMRQWLGDPCILRNPEDLHYIFHHIAPKSPWKAIQQTTMAYTLWIWWKVWNQKVFENRQSPIDSLWHQALQQIEKQINLRIPRLHLTERIFRPGCQIGFDNDGCVLIRP